ncbi:N-formylglutamate amidohydrolase [Demequina rhizosphaerae]|uniref:N-formylglutamate amidohydrolase n=1 Tax=Demequina rhizosphaerae TaxID=1638985 RepID=UPI000AE83A27|nr:N-formylglutamate amidohydrolase [Demequina rhizosphaerae]
MTSPVILHVPHASRAVPPEVRSGILLDDATLERELDAMTDSFTDVIASRAAEAAGLEVLVVAAPVSRLVVDVERFTDGSEPMEAVGMGPVYTRTHDQRTLRDAVNPTLLDRYFHPHAQAVEDAVTAALETHGRAVVIDVHSYPTHRLPYEMAANDAPRPEVCLGTDAAHTPPWLLDAAREAVAGFEIGLDAPFAGTYVPLSRYGHDARVASIMIEIRRDQYMDEDAVEPHSGLEAVASALAELCRRAAAPGPFGQVDRARELAIEAHAGQVDKAGLTYWTHPARVASLVRRLYPDAPAEAVAAAWLHDTVEDTEWTADDLLAAGFPRELVEAVVALSRTSGVGSDDYYARIRELGGIALMFKHADIADNTDEARLARLEPELASRLREKYAHARDVLGLA